MSATQLGLGDAVARVAPAEIGPLERRHMQSSAFRAASDNNKVTATHWHIAAANGLGWGFDGMDGVIFAVVAPFVIKEFAIDLGTYRSGVQIAMFCGYVLWPFVSVYLRQTTGSFQAAFLLIPVIMVIQTVIIWLYSPEYAGKELDEIAL
jgi:MFS family permease